MLIKMLNTFNKVISLAPDKNIYIQSPSYNSSPKTFNKVYTTHLQGGHGTGKTGNLAVNFSRQGKHRELSRFNCLHRENCGTIGKILKI